MKIGVIGTGIMAFQTEEGKLKELAGSTRWNTEENIIRLRVEVFPSFFCRYLRNPGKNSTIYYYGRIKNIIKRQFE